MTAPDTPAPEGPPASGQETESIPQLTIRPADAADSAALAALWEACGLTRLWNDPAKDIAFARAGSASDILAGCAGERIVASVMLGHDGHRGAVYYMAVDPARRGQGLGQMKPEFIRYADPTLGTSSPQGRTLNLSGGKS